MGGCLHVSSDKMARPPRSNIRAFLLLAHRRAPISPRSPSRLALGPPFHAVPSRSAPHPSNARSLTSCGLSLAVPQGGHHAHLFASVAVPPSGHSRVKPRPARSRAKFSSPSHSQASSRTRAPPQGHLPCFRLLMLSQHLCLRSFPTAFQPLGSPLHTTAHWAFPPCAPCFFSSGHATFSVPRPCTLTLFFSSALLHGLITLHLPIGALRIGSHTASRKLLRPPSAHAPPFLPNSDGRCPLVLLSCHLKLPLPSCPCGTPWGSLPSRRGSFLACWVALRRGSARVSSLISLFPPSPFTLPRHLARSYAPSRSFLAPRCYFGFARRFPRFPVPLSPSYVVGFRVSQFSFPSALTFLPLV